MRHSGRDREGLPWSELHGFGVLKLDAEPTVEDEEELVLILVRVPVKLPCMTPRRTRTSPTWFSVWLYQWSVTSSIRAWTSMVCDASNIGS